MTIKTCGATNELRSKINPKPNSDGFKIGPLSIPIHSMVLGLK